MRRTRIIGVWGVFTVCLLSTCLLTVASAQVTEKQLEQKVRTSLDHPAQFDFVEVTLTDVAEFVSDLIDVDVLIDHKSLDDVGIPTDTPVTAQLKEVSLRSALRLTLRDLQLVAVVRDGALVITTPESAESRLETRVYPVLDIVTRKVADKSYRDFDSLIEMITYHIQPDTWDDVGGPCSIEVGLESSLVISATEDVHEDAAAMIKQIRSLQAAVKANPKTLPAVSIGLHDTPADQRIEAALEAGTKLEFIESPLSEVIDFLKEKHAIPIAIDRRALDEIGQSSDDPVTIRTREIPLQTALRRFLEPMDLTTIISNEVLLVTTAEEAEVHLKTRFYPINDLADEEGNVDADSIIEMLTSTIAPDSWDEVGGPSGLEFLDSPPALVMSQTRDVHQHVAWLLTELRSHRPPAAAVEKREPQLTFQVYKLTTLGADNKWKPVSPQAAEKYTELIRKTIGEEEWTIEGAIIDSADDALIIRHYPQVHERVQQALQELSIGFAGGQMRFGGASGFFRIPPRK